MHETLREMCRENNCEKIDVSEVVAWLLLLYEANTSYRNLTFIRTKRKRIERKQHTKLNQKKKNENLIWKELSYKLKYYLKIHKPEKIKLEKWKVTLLAYMCRCYHGCAHSK